MDKDQDYRGSGGFSAVGPAPPKPSMEAIIRKLTGCLHNLAAEVAGISDRIHGASVLGGVNIKEPSSEPQPWADDLRLSASRATDRGEMALKELSRIRETLGL